MMEYQSSLDREERIDGIVAEYLKAVEKGIEVTDLRLLQKSGGKSGDWVR